MSRRPATVTEADIRRVIRAAKHEGATKVEVYLGDSACVVIWLDDQEELEVHEAPRL